MAGTVDLSAPPESVFAVLLDPERLRRVIPGCRALERVGDNRFRGDVTLGVGMVNVRYAAQVDLSELDPPTSLRLKGYGSGSLGTAEGDGRVTLAPHGAGTRLAYEYRVAVGGRLAAVGARMIEGSARVVLARMFKQLDREAGPRPAASPWWRVLRRLFGR
jgi:2-furoyl-CoA dehydrogenase large subunit